MHGSHHGAVDEVAPEDAEDHGAGEEEVEHGDLQSADVEREAVAVGHGRPGVEVNILVPAYPHHGVEVDAVTGGRALDG